MEIKHVMVAQLPVSWFDADGNGPEWPTMAVIAMTTSAGAKVGMDTECGGFFMVPENARKLADALLKAAAESEKMVLEQVS